MQNASHPGQDGMQELQKLPKKLFEDIMLHMHGPALQAVPLLRGLEPSFLAELSLRVMCARSLLWSCVALPGADRHQ